MVVPPLALGTVWVGRKIRVLARRAQDALAEANDVAEESLANMQTVRTFGTESFEGQRYANHTAHAFDLAKERARQRQLHGRRIIRRLCSCRLGALEWR